MNQERENEKAKIDMEIKEKRTIILCSSPKDKADQDRLQ